MSNAFIVYMVPIFFIAGGILLGKSEAIQRSRLKIDELLSEDSEQYEKIEVNNKINFDILIPLICFGIISFIQAFLGKTIITSFISGVIGSACGVIICEQIKRQSKITNKKQIEYYLPLVMERIIMAVDAGLDILPAVKTVVAIERKQRNFLQKQSIMISIDPVSEALSKVSERAEKGQQFEEALQDVAKLYNVPSLHNAFLHLGVAQKEGGELIGPLRELSDATQSQYQDYVEEELAKLPVKATAPLVLTFAGLILFFLSSPLIQILSFATKATPK